MFFSLNYDDFFVYQDACDDEIIVVVNNKVVFRSYDEIEITNFVDAYLNQEV